MAIFINNKVCIILADHGHYPITLPYYTSSIPQAQIL